MEEEKVEKQDNQATPYQVYQATQKLNHAWSQLVNSMLTIGERLERLDSIVTKTQDGLADCQLTLQKKLIGAL